MTKPISRNLTLRQAKVADLVPICSFYQDNRNPYLPIVPLKQISDSVEDNNFYIIEDKSAGEILATSAIFRISPNSSKDYVGEISGMQVSRKIGGTLPISVQTLLLGVRLVGHLYTSGMNEEGFSNSLITIVHKDNQKIISNIRKANFSELSEKPDWFAYDQASFAEGANLDAWIYFHATKATIRDSVKILNNIKFFDGSTILSRVNKFDNSQESFFITIEINLINTMKESIPAVIAGEFECDISVPPLYLAY